MIETFGVLIFYFRVFFSDFREKVLRFFQKIFDICFIKYTPKKMDIQLYLLIGILMFSLGIYILLSKKNAIMLLVGIELMLNAANLNLLAFSNYHQQSDGQILSLFVMVVAAAEVAIALAITIQIYKYFKNTNLDELKTLHS
jgi:NADH-quinone oxidoreductase subunit K